MISSRFPLILFAVLAFIGMSLYVLRYLGVEMVFYTNLLIVIVCAPGFMIGLMMSVALSIRSADSRENNNILRTYSIEKSLHVLGLIAVSLLIVTAYAS